MKSLPIKQNDITSRLAAVHFISGAKAEQISLMEQDVLDTIIDFAGHMVQVITDNGYSHYVTFNGVNGYVTGDNTVTLTTKPDGVIKKAFKYGDGLIPSLLEGEGLDDEDWYLIVTDSNNVQYVMFIIGVVWHSTKLVGMATYMRQF